MSKPTPYYARKYPGLSTLSTLTNCEVAEYSNTGAHAKRQLHRNGTRFLDAIAAELGLSERARSNKGGAAVAGEVTLHSENVYIHVSHNTRGVYILWRRPLNAKNSVRWDNDGQNRYIHLNAGVSIAAQDARIDMMVAVFRRWIEEEKS